MPGHKEPLQNDTLTFVSEEMTYEEVIKLFNVFGNLKYVNKYIDRYFVQFENPEVAKVAHSELGRIYRVAFAHAKTYPRPRKNFRPEGERIRIAFPADLPSSGYTASTNPKSGMAMIQEFVKNSARRHMAPASTPNEVVRSNENLGENVSGQENRRERDRELEDQGVKPKGSQNGREMARGSRNRKATSKGSDNRRQRAKGSENRRETDKGSENRREPAKGSENRREKAKSSQNQSQTGANQNQRSKLTNPKPNSSQVRDPEHDESNVTDDNIEEPEAEKSEAEKHVEIKGQAKKDVYEFFKELDLHQIEFKEAVQRAEACALGASSRRHIDLEELEAMMRELGHDRTYSVIVANIPKKYNFDEVYDLVEEVRPIAFSDMRYSVKMRVKFCEVFVNDQNDVDYLKRKLHDFVICGKQLTVMERDEILDETRWKA